MSLWTAKALLGFTLLLGAKNSVQADPLHIPADMQEEFRQAVCSYYHQEIAEGGYYDDVNEKGIRPKLRILDCLDDRCLLDIETDPNWWSSLYFVTIRENHLVDMKPANIAIGTVIDRACFVQLKAPIETTAIYVISDTHQGTRYEQLADATNLTKQFASYAFHTYWYEKKGATNYFQLARHVLSQLPKPFEF